MNKFSRQKGRLLLAAAAEKISHPGQLHPLNVLPLLKSLAISPAKTNFGVPQQSLPELKQNNHASDSFPGCISHSVVNQQHIWLRSLQKIHKSNRQERRDFEQQHPHPLHNLARVASSEKEKKTCKSQLFRE